MAQKRTIQGIENKKKYDIEYLKNNTRVYGIRFNKAHEKDYIEYLDGIDNVTSYIKSLILEDMKKKGQNTMTKELKDYIYETVSLSDLSEDIAKMDSGLETEYYYLRGNHYNMIGETTLDEFKEYYIKTFIELRDNVND